MPDDIRGHAEVAAAVRMPVATGEIHATRWEFQELVDRRAAAILQADAGVCGGITEWRKIAAMAASNNISIAPTGSRSCTSIWSAVRPTLHGWSISPISKC